MSSGYYEMIKKLEERIEELEKKFKNETPLWKHVLGQAEFFNGHGQLTISEIKLSEIKILLKDLEVNCNSLDNMFYVSLFWQDSGYWSGCIQQVITGKEDKLWVDFDRVIIDTKENENV